MDNPKANTRSFSFFLMVALVSNRWFFHFGRLLKYLNKSCAVSLKSFETRNFKASVMDPSMVSNPTDAAA